MAASIAQFTKYDGPATPTQPAVTTAFAGNTTTGNTLTVFIRCAAAGETITSVTTPSNTLSLVGSNITQDPHEYIYEKLNITGETTPAVTVVWGGTPGNAYMWVGVLEVAGIPTSSARDTFDFHAVGVGATDQVTNAFSTTLSGIVIMASAAAAFGPYTAGTDFTLQDGQMGNATSNHFGGIQYYVTSAPLSSYTAHFNGPSAAYTTAMIAYKATGGSGGGGGGLPFFLQGDVRHGFKQQRSGGMQ